MSEEPASYNAGPEEIEGLYVTIDDVQYHPELPSEPGRPYPQVYFITIHNESDRTVTLLKRKWVVTDAYGDKIVVEGNKIVGKTPHLEPGQSFSYNSYHIIGSDSIAEGSYHGLDDLGRRIFVKIPPFTMRVPLEDL
jgi:ApaG protein